MKNKYIEECKFIKQNCTYTAEAHHQMAAYSKRQAFWLEVIPSILAALSGALVSANIWSHEILIVTVISSAVAAVSAVLNPNKTYQAHLEAAKNFTTLKHDARFLSEARAESMNDDVFSHAVENLHQKYNELLKTVPPTNAKSFKKAQEIVQGGVHESDKDEKGKIR